jgi:hypothetical protein
MRGAKKVLSAELLKRIVASTTYDVIRGEFIREFNSMCPNIEAIIKQFDKAAIVLEFDDVQKRIGSFQFEHAYGTKEIIDLWEKISLLYEIGFIGFRVATTDRGRGSNKIAEVFYFSDGDKLFASMTEEDKRNLEFVIHPVFSEVLRLKTDAHAFCLKYSDDYVRENDLVPPWA